MLSIRGQEESRELENLDKALTLLRGLRLEHIRKFLNAEVGTKVILKNSSGMHEGTLRSVGYDCYVVFGQSINIKFNHYQVVGVSHSHNYTVIQL